MDKKDVAARETAQVRERIERFVEAILQAAYGAQGSPDWGTLFSEIEELGVQVGDAVRREFVRRSVATRAEQESPEANCPTCGCPLERRDVEPRVLLTRRGEVGWQQPQDYCVKCHKASFPSGEKPGAFRTYAAAAVGRNQDSAKRFLRVTSPP